MISTPDVTHIPLQRRLLSGLEVLLCCGIPTQLAIASLLTAAGWSSTTEAAELSPSFVITLLTIDTILLVVIMVVFLRAGGESPSALWIGPRTARSGVPPIRVRREVLIGIVLVPLLLVGAAVLMNGLRLVVPSLHNVERNPLEQLANGSTMDAGVFGLVAIVAGGVREELQRAFLLHRFEQHLGGRVVGVLVTSVGFGALHLTQGRDAAIVIGTIGAFWALLYLDRRSSIAPIVSHAGFNGLEILRVALGPR